MLLPRGFTLIELLIVVAIIAILAAIAVPNFLQAQVNGKVARALADMRTIATAVEAYRVDHNRYPPSRNVDVPRVVMSRLTTPVAYLSSVPEDVFKRLDNKFGKADPEGWERQFRFYTKNDVAADFSVGGWNDPDYGLGFPQYEWGIYSRGPDLYFNWDLPGEVISRRNPKVVQYDPTNGTVSRGDLYRWGS